MLLIVVLEAPPVKYTDIPDPVHPEVRRQSANEIRLAMELPPPVQLFRIKIAIPSAGVMVQVSV
ncbi:hypothetical protein, partial [Stenotrophomonas maltophilia]|uniref:hypothetical protein n=1 Tax=Stenotrophomonas maltophilia TaxID=40324 RepID=UPI001952C64E